MESLIASYGAIYALSVLTPAQETLGYVLDFPSSQRRIYQLNGFRVLVASVIMFIYSVNQGSIPGDLFFRNYGQCALAACFLGLVVSLVSYGVGRQMRDLDQIDKRDCCPTIDSQKGSKLAASLTSEVAVTTKGKRSSSPSRERRPSKAVSTTLPSDFDEFNKRSELEHIYCGLSNFNPTWPGGIDAKMWLYVVGAVQLELNILSTVAAHIYSRRTPSVLGGIQLGDGYSIGYGMFTYAALLTFFVVDYMIMEHVHLQTYDLFRERIGLKLIWGCMFFYPFFYAIGGISLANASNKDISLSISIFCFILFFIGWTLTRGANLQKSACKAGQDKFSWCGFRINMSTVPGSNGRILNAGFWGLSRHVNYLGEILQALSLALPGFFATGSLVPFLYPAYYIALFIPRQIDDDAICAKKHGVKVWSEYCNKVPYRIVPYVY
jgi:hypothetical protein